MARSEAQEIADVKKALRGAASKVFLTCLLFLLIVSFVQVPAAGADYGRAVAPDGSWISAELAWENMPAYYGMPMHNQDNTFYPGDAFAVKLDVFRTFQYRTLRVSSENGVIVPTEFIVYDNAYSGVKNFEILSGARTGPQRVDFTLVPALSILTVEAYEWTYVPPNPYNPGGWYPVPISSRVAINGSDAGKTPLQLDVEQGVYTISFEDLSSENLSGPSPRQIGVLPGRSYWVKAYYAPLGSERQPSTETNGEDPNAFSRVPEITASVEIRVVPYNPKFAVVPYLMTNPENLSFRDAYDMPFAVLVRYDGNRYDPENSQKLSLSQRAIVNWLSFRGSMTCVQRAENDQQRLKDNGDPDFYENGDPVMYRKGDVMYYDNGWPKVEEKNFTLSPGEYAPYVQTDKSLRLFVRFENERPTGFFVLDNKQGAMFGENAVEFLKLNLKPVVFDENSRYHKFVFFIEDSLKSRAREKGGLLDTELLFSSGARGPQKLVFVASASWQPIGFSQPVVVRAWRLKREVAENLASDPGIVLKENSWEINPEVRFTVQFVPLIKVKEIAENMRSVVSEYFSAIGLPELDNYMLDQVVKDTMKENEPIQTISGSGSKSENILRYGSTLFLLKISASQGEKTKERSSLVSLDFNPDENYEVDINLSGEGLTAKVIDGRESFRVAIYSPPQAGYLSKVILRDSGGNVLIEKNFSDKISVHEFEVVKQPGQTKFTLEMTNGWGATVFQGFEVEPFASAGPDFTSALAVLLLAALGVVAWNLILRYFRSRD